MFQTALHWWKYAAAHEGGWRATRRLIATLWEFARDSTPERRRSRFGDADYDWDFRVNTTSGAVDWRDRLLGMFHSAYQPTEPVAFHEMIAALRTECDVTLREFTFVDLGSGKGRTLLMASDYPFLRIVGVELLPSLNAIAMENIRKYKSDSQQCFALDSICTDATSFEFPRTPLVLYLFNPLPESGMREVMVNLQQSIHKNPRRVLVVYHNPLLEHTLTEIPLLTKLGAGPGYSLFGN